MPGAGGSLSGESYQWGKLRFSNGTEERNITDANTANWISSTLQYWEPSGMFPGFGTIISGNLNSWQGYFVEGKHDNITLIRQN